MLHRMWDVDATRNPQTTWNGKKDTMRHGSAPLQFVVVKYWQSGLPELFDSVILIRSTALQFILIVRVLLIIAPNILTLDGLHYWEPDGVCIPLTPLVSDDIFH